MRSSSNQERCLDYEKPELFMVEYSTERGFAGSVQLRVHTEDRNNASEADCNHFGNSGARYDESTESLF